MNRCFNTKKLAGVIFAMVMAWIAAIPVYAQQEGIAVVESLKGEVIVESRGLWRKNPEKGSAVHHGDKIVTTDKSSLQLKFHDGSALDISSNSNVRVTQPLQRDVFADGEIGKREIRVFVGKTTYKSGEGKHVGTHMVSPTAVAALRGTIVDFGSDGNYSHLNIIEGKSDNKGNITEGHVPEVTPEQAAKNPNYQATLTTFNAFQKYEQAKKTSSPDANVLFVEAVKKSAEALVTENKSLENNPDEAIKSRAVEGLKKSEEAVQKADSALKSVQELQKKATDLVQKSQNQPEGKQGSELLLKAGAQAQEAIRDSVKSVIEIADSVTSSKYDTKFIQELERTTVRNLEMAADLAKSTEKKVEAFVSTSMSSKELSVAAAALKAAEVLVSSIEANATVTDVAAKAVQSALNGDKADTQKLNQSLTKTMEIAGNISDKSLQAETTLQKVETASANNDATAVKQAMQEMTGIQADTTTQLKSAPLPSQSEVVTPTTTVTQTKPDAAAAQTVTTQTATDQPATTSAETTPAETSTSSGASGTTSDSTSTTTSTSMPSSESTLAQQPPPLQDAKKVPTVTPYGQ